MVTVKEALEIIKSSVFSLKTVEIRVKDGLGYNLAKDYFSPISFPPFSQSAMDGYAMNFLDDNLKFEIIGEIKAGDDGSQMILSNNQAARVFTGAMIPKNTTAVVKQEDVERNGSQIILKNTVKPMENIRPLGEQIREGELLAKMNTLLTPGSIGHLLTLGIEKVDVFKKPLIKIITTGNELTPVGMPLKTGKIYESNSGTLLAALEKYGFSADCEVVEDNYELTKMAIDKAMRNYDLVLITGGISVGDYDFVGKALTDLAVQELFYKVKQRPGKPLYFGKKDETFLFGLPGNPASVLTSFYIYVLPALQLLIGQKTPFLHRRFVKLNTDFPKKAGLTFFLKGKLEEDSVEILEGQSSAMLGAFLEANCLIKIEENVEKLRKGDEVEVIVF